MPPKEINSLPFLTRKMLDFGESASFALIISASAGLSAPSTILVRGVTKAGTFTFSCAVAGTGSQENFTFPIPDIPIFLSITRENDILLTNRVWVVAKLSINGDVGMILTQGYPNTNISISWPFQTTPHPLSAEGNISFVTVANPAAGAEWTKTVTANQVWELVAIRFKFTASAVVANRRPGIEIDTTPDLQVSIPSPANIVASQTSKISFYRGAIGTDDQIGFRQTASLPEKYFLEGGTIIKSLTPNIDAGDQYSEVVLTLKIYHLT